MTITAPLFEAFLKCPTKCHLLSRGEAGSGNGYADWVRTQNESYRTEATRRLIGEVPQAECVIGPPAGNPKRARWRLAVGFLAGSENVQSCLHAIERVPSEGGGKAAQFIPVRFTFTNKLTKDDRLLLAFDAHILSAMLGREVRVGRIVHGDDHATLRVKIPSLVGEVRKRIAKVAELLGTGSPPDLILNRHCAECEFRDRCRQKEMEKDDLSLLGGMTEKERKKYHSKGIFTITQLSYTFRPRRRPKRLRDKREKYHHALKALAIREKKIHVVGSPELKIEGTPVYLDVEGLPDRDFYYLIGVRIKTGDSVVQHSLWVDSPDEEKKIWSQFLGILASVQNPVIVHYGSFETTFLRRMTERYGGPPEGCPAERAMGIAVNLLSVIFARIYFPTYSNGLKEVAGWLGFKWSESASSGTQAICWRHQWNTTAESTAKQKLITYNSEDCAADVLIAETILRIQNESGRVNSDRGARLEVNRADSAEATETMWPRFSSPIEGFEAINQAARWDYQRDRVYVRTDEKLKAAARKGRIHGKGLVHPNKEIICERLLACPQCGGMPGRAVCARTKLLYDLRFTKFGIRRWVVKYHFHNYWCPSCHNCFGTPKAFWLRSRYGRNLVSFIVFSIIELSGTQRAVAQNLSRLFGLDIHEVAVHRAKASAAKFYEGTRQGILAQMVKGSLIHADETRVVLKDTPAYVWVFATFHGVVYFYAETREGDLLQEALKGFSGVLVSDFYAAYESIPCPQQKCLIHLMRDLNDAVLARPYDEEVKSIATGFADLLRGIVASIDRWGLKRHFLRKHHRDVDRFYRRISNMRCQGETALKCKERFEKNRDKLFTFLDHDGVPWNNNNAEHAIKAFGRLRRTIEGLSTPKGIEEYLVLLSVCQTCKYQGLDFLDFLRSGETDIDAFAQKQPKRRRPGWKQQPPSHSLIGTPTDESQQETARPPTAAH